MNAIEIKGLNKVYHDFALKNINLEIPYGSVLGLIGSNGAGKSSTIKSILHTIQYDEGKIQIMGIDNKDKKFRNLFNDIGIVMDDAYFPDVLNAKNVSKVMKNTYSNWDEKKFFHYIESFKLPMNRVFKKFSRGMRMKMAIAVALSHHPKVLILDEATGGLDPIARDEILDVFNEFVSKENHAILMSSHIVSDLEKICDYIAFIHQGQVMFSKPKQALIDDYAIATVSISDYEKMSKGEILGKREFDDEVVVFAPKFTLPTNAIFKRHDVEDIILFLARRDA